VRIVSSDDRFRDAARYVVVVEINVGIVSALVAGLVALVVAVLGLIPNIGRLRRLERIAAILEKTTDEEGRRRLLAIRDNLIASVEPKRAQPRNQAFVGLLLAAIGYGLVLGAWYSIDSANYGEAKAPFWMYAWIVTAALLLLIGAVVGLVGLTRSYLESRAADSAPTVRN
jgi:succinate dehydrogenase hydrophobic anchor subunit